MRKWFMILMAVMLCLTMAACGSNEAEPEKLGTEMVQDAIAEREENKQEVADKSILGSWTTDGTTWTFEEDGIGKIVVSVISTNDAGADFYYTAEDGTLDVTIGDDEKEMNYTIDGDKLILKGEAGTATYTRVK